MECKGIELLHANFSFLRCFIGSDGYSASWKRYDIASHRTFANFSMNYLTLWTKRTSEY